MRQTQELIAIVPWTFIAQICNLFIQLGLIKRFLFRPINEVIEARKSLADSQLSEARETMERAQDLEAAGRAEVEQAREKAQDIVLHALKMASAHSDTIIDEAKTQAAGIRAKAEADISLERRQAALQLKKEVGGMALELAKRVIGREVKAKDHKRLIEDFIRNTGEAS